MLYVWSPYTKASHQLKPGCKDYCLKKCKEKISYSTRLFINKEFWLMVKKEQRNFILNSTTNTMPKRKTVDHISRRKKTITYYFKDKKGLKQEVCKQFFLTTLGYKPNNDKLIRNVLSKADCMSISAKPDRRSSNRPKPVIDRDIIKKHIESFQPQVSHYRREHAQRRRYLPSDLTIQFMYNDFKEKFPNMTLSYNLYWQVLSDMNISFSKLGHEECWACEIFIQHSTSTGHKKDALVNDCGACAEWYNHFTKYTNARKEYQKDAACQGHMKITITADLQKVIMLPRCDTFKEVIFVPRLIAFNESFIPAGKSRIVNPVAIVWHEGIMGRLKENIINTIYAYFLTIRDIEQVTLWLDNCSAQNKKWALFCFFIYLINSKETALETLNVKYFEPGHTFMAADSFHHQVESSLKRKGKVYDFSDFKEAVKKAHKNVNVIELTSNDNFEWKDSTSQYKLKKIVPRPYIADMIHLTFQRGKHTFIYKKSFDEISGSELNILTAKEQKQGIIKPNKKLQPRGISKQRKITLISKLSSIIPSNRLLFWETLPETDQNMEDPLTSDGE